ncbi:MAG: hypothetical protein LWW77_07485 [Propionibacteriales bacterium]|nr:hypothetical protein [Propionibacteriales bacterium]
MPTSKNRLARIIRRSHAPLALAIAAMLALAGCGVDVIHAQPVPSPATSAPAADGPVAEPTPTITETPGDTETVVPSPSESQTGEPTELDLARRSYYADKVDVTTGCPGGEIVLDQSMRVTMLTEPCERVVVTNSFNTLLAGEVGTLEIREAASHGHFLIGQLGSAKVAAPFNKVYWDSGNPKLTVTGFKCVVKPNPAKE